MRDQQLQIRLTSRQKVQLKERARRARQDVSTYVLDALFPPAGRTFLDRVAAVQDEGGSRFSLAALHDLLAELTSTELAALPEPDLARVPEVTRCLVAAMVEHVCGRSGAIAPRWVGAIPPLAAPWFASDLRSLRLHLLHASPVAYRRRNLFVDAGVGTRA